MICVNTLYVYLQQVGFLSLMWLRSTALDLWRYLRMERVARVWTPPVLLQLQAFTFQRFVMCHEVKGNVILAQKDI